MRASSAMRDATRAARWQRGLQRRRRRIHAHRRRGQPARDLRHRHGGHGSHACGAGSNKSGFQAMRLERIILSLAALLLLGGFAAWAVGGFQYLRSVGIWLWFGAFAVLSLPMLGWLIDRIVHRRRD
jgi:hypothetical protein